MGIIVAIALTITECFLHQAVSYSILTTSQEVINYYNLSQFTDAVIKDYRGEIACSIA